MAMADLDSYGLAEAAATQPFWTAVILAVVLALPLWIAHRQSRRITVFKPQAPAFRFLDLPAELRNLVYEQLVDHTPTYPPPTLPRKRFSCLGWLVRPRRTPRKNAIMLVNRQIHGEFQDAFCKQARFTFDLDENNAKTKGIWSINEDTLPRIRHCQLRVHATSKMLGALDPRSIPEHWQLRDKVAGCLLEPMRKVESLQLRVKAVPDPLWNPVWMWYHISQHFKQMDSPAFTSITFEIEGGWTLGEHHLERGGEGRWQWTCGRGHAVVDDSAGWQPIREFCAALYMRCAACQEEVSEA